MKRYSRIFEQIIDYQNIRLAFLGAIRGNRKSPAVINFCRNTAGNLFVIREKLRSLECNWGGYRSFLITDPKLRVISTASIEQRIMHHAIIDPLISVFERPMIYHSYACRMGKGTHAAVRYAFGQCKAHAHFLKLDIRKYFDSINHDALKAQLHRLIKDTRVMVLLQGIIDSYQTAPGKGVPIGNLTSQYFANYYLSGFDHFIKKQCGVRNYGRYVDDCIIVHRSRAFLKKIIPHIKEYLKENLDLILHPRKIYLQPCTKGVQFLGTFIKPSHIVIHHRTLKNFKKSLRTYNIIANNHKPDKDERSAFISSMNSYLGILKHYKTFRKRKLLLQKHLSFYWRKHITFNAGIQKIMIKGKKK